MQLINYDFPVTTRDIYATQTDEYNPIKIPKRQAVVRTDTDEVLSIISDKYQIIRHAEVIDTFNELLPLESWRLSEDGGILFAKYRFNNDELSNKEIKKGDFVRFHIRVFNSYNLATGCGFELRGDRLICTNGMTVPTKVSGFSFKHLNNDGRRNLSLALEGYAGAVERIVDTWKEWTSYRPDDSKILQFFNKVNITDDNAEELIEEALDKDSLWEIYNVLTKYTSHTMINRGKNKIANQRKKDLEYSNAFYKFNWR